MRNAAACIAWIVAALGYAAGCRTHAPPNAGATRELLVSPVDAKRRIEIYWRKPTGPGPFPVLVLLHGHQEPGPQRIGGRAFAEWGVLRQTVDAGVVAVAISQPGYGGSDGPPDYCGPASQASVVAVLRHLRGWSFVDGKRIALEGISRGAVVAALVAAQDNGLAGVVLISGVYDLGALYARDPSCHIMQNFVDEAGPLSSSVFAARSALSHVQRIKVPVLILSGARDPIAPAEQAQAFAQALSSAGGDVELATFPDAAHHIPAGERAPIIARFLNRTLHPARPLP